MAIKADGNWGRRMKWVYLAILLAGVSVFSVVSKADLATPFVEINNKVGDVSEAHGYVVALGPDIEKCTHFLVIVTTDTMQHVVINARAKKKLIPQSLLGRQVLVKAKVTRRTENPKTKKITTELEILSVRPMVKRKASSEKPKASRQRQ